MIKPKKKLRKVRIAAPKNALVSKFGTLADTLRGVSIGQDDMIRTMLLAVLAKEHMLTVGPWGCNKTGSINAMLTLMGCDKQQDVFSITLDKYTSPEALLGMYSISELKKDRYVRSMQGKLPTARFAFIGEVFRGNGAVRAACHTILNERYVDNDGMHVPCPLHTAFLDSNSYPVREEDFPFYDRLLLRYDVSYLPVGSASNSFTNMLEMTEFSQQDIAPVLTVDEVLEASAQVSNVTIDSTIVSLVSDIRDQLAGQQITCSDRRWKRSLNILRAAAWIRGDKEVTPADLHVYSHILWSTPDQKADIGKVLAAYNIESIKGSDDQILQEVLMIKKSAEAYSADSTEYADAYSTVSSLITKVVDAKIRRAINDIIGDMEAAITTGVSL